MRQYIPEHSPQRQSQTSPDPHHPKRPGRSRRGAKTKTTRRPRYCFARPSGVSDGAPQTLATEDLRLSERPSRSRSLTQGEAVARQRALETAVRRPKGASALGGPGLSFPGEGNTVPAAA